MTTPHPYRLRAYHNPQKLDESKVPVGWRLKYADEANTPLYNAMWRSPHMGWKFTTMFGREPEVTYIVPVAP